MQYLERLELFQRGIRSQVCVKCSQRPAGSENWPPTQRRDCQDTCPIFASLPKIVGAAVRQMHEAPPIPAETLMREMVCQSCRLSPSAGDYCAESLSRSCPLSRYSQDVLDVLQNLMQPRK